MPPKTSRATKDTSRDGRKLGMEKLVERVFIQKPRTLSFSHRFVGSLRHPYTRLVHEASLEPTKIDDRLTYVLESFLDAKAEKEHWQRVERIFDSKLGDALMEKAKLDLLLSPELLQSFEVLWCNLGGVGGGCLTEDTYKQFQQRLYFILFDIHDMTLLPASMQFIQTDIIYDFHGEAALDFAGFASSMLELADNWTSTRAVADHVAFVQKIIDAFPTIATAGGTVSRSHDFTLSQNTFFHGGVVVPKQVGGTTVYCCSELKDTNGTSATTNVN